MIDAVIAHVVWEGSCGGFSSDRLGPCLLVAAGDKFVPKLSTAAAPLDTWVNPSMALPPILGQVLYRGGSTC